MRVQLNDFMVQLVSECGYLWMLVIRHRDNHVFGFEVPVTGRHTKSITFPPESIYLDRVLHRQVKSLHVVAQVVSHLILSGKRVAASGKSQSGKSGIPRRVEKTK